jgi:hypothetical protein
MSMNGTITEFAKPSGRAQALPVLGQRAGAAAARMANVALTAQVQFAHACASRAAESAENAARCIERSWPQTPLRAIAVATYVAQATQSRNAALEVLRQARRRCGLAFARLPYGA